MPRILLEGFPQNEWQAKFFVKNCVMPTRVFILKCCKDRCQERMFKLGENHEDYIPSSILSRKISDYNKSS